MEKDRCIAALLADSAALAEAARLGLDAAGPSCPGWSVADLVEHTGRVHRSETRRVRDLESERHSAADIALPTRSELVGWFEAGAEALARVLEAAEPDAPVWNWSVTPNLASFWWRRMAQETAVHRWDGQTAHARWPAGLTPMSAARQTEPWRQAPSGGRNQAWSPPENPGDPRVSLRQTVNRNVLSISGVVGGQFRAIF